MSAASATILHFEDLVKGFWVDGVWRPVIRGLTLSLPQGRALALLGLGCVETPAPREAFGLEVLRWGFRPDWLLGTRYGRINRADEGRLTGRGDDFFPISREWPPSAA